MDEYGLGYNEIIIPSRSVKNSDADNILESGPMTGSTTSFRIANGVYPDDSDGRDGDRLCGNLEKLKQGTHADVFGRQRVSVKTLCLSKLFELLQQNL